MFSKEIAINMGLPESMIELVYPSIKMPVKEDNLEMYHPFILPINYLDKKKIHKISNTVNADLELNKTIYKHLFQPEDEFSENLMKEWSKQMTSDINFLEESQLVIHDMDLFEDKKKTLNTKRILEVWKDTKDNKNFLDKYYYMDWNQFLYLNKSSSFLQLLSVANVLSPLISLLIPIVLLILPFIVLKIQGMPLTFEMYIEVLKETAKHHFIGKAILNIQDLSWDKTIYVILTFGLYLFQIYQNMNICNRFYNNLKTINTNLISIREYICRTTEKMDLFVKLHESKNTYKDFCNDIKYHSKVLNIFCKELSIIGPFKHNLSKSSECGYLLKCYYDLQNDDLYDLSLRYSIGFNGYIGNMIGVNDNIKLENMCNATFTEEKTKENKMNMKEQYYPLLKDNKEVVRNNITLKKNMIITGPNASGKTTLLKTTAINIIITQQFGSGFYKSCHINPYSHIHSYLNIPDTSERDSLFQAESRRCKDILDQVNESGPEARHFCIFDELYSGTNPIEATKAAHAFLSYMCKYDNVDFILTTHYIDICTRFEKKDKKRQLDKQIVNYKMNVDEVDGKFEYKYSMSKGISKIQGAIRIFEEMGYPEEILNNFRI